MLLGSPLSLLSDTGGCPIAAHILLHICLLPSVWMVKSPWCQGPRWVLSGSHSILTAEMGCRPEAGVKYLRNKLKHLALWADASFYNNFHLKLAQYIFNEIFYKTFNSPQFISSGKWVSSLKWWAGFRLHSRYLRRRSDPFKMLFPLNNISFSFHFFPFSFFFFFSFHGASMALLKKQVRASTKVQMPPHCYCARQTLQAKTNPFDNPLSNLLVGSAPNIGPCLSFPICLTLPTFYKAF